ncbi:MAG: enoyl-CoA hydratase-related protein [Pseudomonadota bacterium]
MSEDSVLYAQHGAVAVITLNREDTMNSLSGALWSAWVAALARANEDDSIAAIVITANGKAFCAGGDMHEGFLPKMRGEEPYDPNDHRLGGLGLPFDWIRIIRESKPTIAAVNGLAVGGGATSILPCDVIVASEQASFHFMFAKLGLVPELGSSHFLVKRVGFAHASEILLSARAVDAQEALAFGLVNAVVPADALLGRALEYANAIAVNPSPMVQLIKDLLTKNSEETDIDAIWRRESDALRQCLARAEHREAVEAFLEKRTPDFAAVRAKGGEG